MPELAEVEYFRKQWDPGIGRRIVAIALHSKARVFRGLRPNDIRRAMVGSALLGSEARGKQMLFAFSRGVWLGLHLGLTGGLRLAPPDLKPGKHDHLVLYQTQQSLVFSDLRQFGRVRLHQGAARPMWWSRLAAGLTSREFSQEILRQFMSRHARLPVKAALLLQEGFPGIGNWMADEILWRVRVHPGRRCGQLGNQTLASLWRTVRWVSRRALETIGQDFSDPPRGWLFHQRWHTGGQCPRDSQTLRRKRIGGRATAWCPVCQPD